MIYEVRKDGNSWVEVEAESYYDAAMKRYGKGLEVVGWARDGVLVLEKDDFIVRVRQANLDKEWLRRKISDAIFEMTGNIGHARDISLQAVEYVDMLYEGLL